MRKLLAKLFGGGRAPSEKLLTALQAGAMIVDVRSENEFAGGHADGAINVPLGGLPGALPPALASSGSIVLCCRSGARSARATEILREAGVECVDGGGWQAVQRAIDDFRNDTQD